MLRAGFVHGACGVPRAASSAARSRPAHISSARRASAEFDTASSTERLPDSAPLLLVDGTHQQRTALRISQFHEQCHVSRRYQIHVLGAGSARCGREVEFGDGRGDAQHVGTRLRGDGVAVLPGQGRREDFVEHPGALRTDARDVGRGHFRVSRLPVGLEREFHRVEHHLLVRGERRARRHVQGVHLFGLPALQAVDGGLRHRRRVHDATA